MGVGEESNTPICLHPNQENPEKSRKKMQKRIGTDSLVTSTRKEQYHDNGKQLCGEKRRSTHSFLAIVFFQFLLTHFVFLSFPNLSYY